MYMQDEFDEASTEASELLKTIIFPKRFMNLTDKLPKPNYTIEETIKRKE